MPCNSSWGSYTPPDLPGHLHSCARISMYIHKTYTYLINNKTQIFQRMWKVYCWDLVGSKERAGLTCLGWAVCTKASWKERASGWTEIRKKVQLRKKVAENLIFWVGGHTRWECKYTKGQGVAEPHLYSKWKEGSAIEPWVDALWPDIKDWAVLEWTRWYSQSSREGHHGLE